MSAQIVGAIAAPDEFEAEQEDLSPLEQQVKELLIKIGANMAPPPVVQHADTVNVDQPREKIPHVKIVACVTFFVLIGFGGVSLYVLAKVNDPTIKGAVIGTWTTLANLAAGFWLGSSVGGKLNK